MVRSLCLVIVLVAGSSPPWAQADQFAHSPAEEKACRGDAHRFCKDDLSDEFRTASCLQDHRDQISRACRAVMENHH
jgi:cysteine rich repeat protein